MILFHVPGNLVTFSLSLLWWLIIGWDVVGLFVMNLTVIGHEIVNDKRSNIKKKYSKSAIVTSFWVLDSLESLSQKIYTVGSRLI